MNLKDKGLSDSFSKIRVFIPLSRLSMYSAACKSAAMLLILIISVKSYVCVKQGKYGFKLSNFFFFCCTFVGQKMGNWRLGEERLEKDLDRVEFDGGGSGCGGE